MSTPATERRPFRVVINGTFVLQPPGSDPVVFEATASHGDNGTEIVFTNKNGAPATSILKLVIPDVSQLPAILQQLVVGRFLVQYGKADDASEFSIELDTTFQLREGKLPLTTRLSYHASATTGSVKTALTQIDGEFSYGDHDFKLQFLSKTTGGKNTGYVIGMYELKREWGLRDLAQIIFTEQEVRDFSLPAIGLNNLKLFFARSTVNKADKAGYLVGFRIKVPTEKLLQSLPVIGEVAAKYKPFSLDELILVYASLPGKETDHPYADPDEVGFLFTEKLEIQSPGIEIDKIGPGLNVFTDFIIRRSSPDIPEKQVAGTSKKTEVITPGPVKLPVRIPAADGITWKAVDFSMLGVQVKRVGYRAELDKNRFTVFIDANLSLSVLSLQVRGLGFEFDTKSLFSGMPKVTFSGLGISFKKDPVEISGAFLESKLQLSTGETVTAYSGAVVIKLSKFRIVGIGSYAKYQEKTSLFLYGAFDGVIGGDPAFFVTGIAAGFGYNRTLRIPAIEKVREFPLVSIVLNPDPAKTMMDILDELIQTDAVPISDGDYWLAAGIKFTTYQVLESFILLIVLFGRRLEFVIMGLSILRWPREGEMLANVELVIMARFSTDSEVITIQGMITPSSWIFSKDCKLGGGFAFYTWIKGPHAGDFVITIGGYHPRFNKPAHYPVVDRLSLNWQVTSDVSIRGELYYALTSSSIMAGGKWQLSYTSPRIKASLLLWADLLIAWAPFYYDIEAGVLIKVDANVEALFISFHGSAELSALLRIWGPPFAGRAHVSWSIISFDINFGDQEGTKPADLTLGEFCRTFIPESTLGPNDHTQVNPVKITIEDGILEEVNTGVENYCIVNAGQLKIKLDSLIPLTRGKTFQPDFPPAGEEIAIAPMGAGKVESELFFTIRQHLNGQWKTLEGYAPGNYLNKDGNGLLFEYQGDQLTQPAQGIAGHDKGKYFEYRFTTTRLPASLWAKPVKPVKDAAPEDPKMVQATAGLYIQLKKDTTVQAPRVLNTLLVTESRQAQIPYFTSTDAAYYTNARETILANLADRKHIVGELESFIEMTRDAANDPRQKAWVTNLQGQPAVCSIGQLPRYNRG